MGARRRQRKARRSRVTEPVRDRFDAGESRPAVAVTVAWMLCQVAAAASLVVAWSMRIWGATAANETLLFLGRVWGMVAGLLALLAVILTIAAWRVRAVPPPRSLIGVVLAIVIAAMISGYFL